MDHVNLHNHDYYSILDGLGSPEEYFVRAKELGMDSLAQTNHGSLRGLRHFQRAAKEAGIKPIAGIEAYVTHDRFDKSSKASRDTLDSVYNHLIILAQNQTGLENLQAMNEESWVNGYFYKNRVDWELLEQYGEGLIVLSGCLNGMIAKALDSGEPNAFEIAIKTAQKFQGIFGDRFFIEHQSHNPKHIFDGLLAVGDQLGIKHVITSDCHYVRAEDLWVEEAMLILSTSPKKNASFDYSLSQKMDVFERYNYLYPDRKMSFQDLELHLKSSEEHLADLSKLGYGKYEEMVSNSQLIADMVEPYEYYENLDLFPKPKGIDEDAALRAFVYAGLKEKGLDTDQKYIDRVDHELGIIGKKSFASYFLIGREILAFCKENGIMTGTARGSAGGSMVCFCLDMVKTDPLKYNLLFFRFLDENRPDWPDWDFDIEDKRRGEVRAFISEKFGHVSDISTMTYFKDKNVIKDAARVYGVPLKEVNKLNKRIATFEDFEDGPEAADFRDKYPEVLKLAKRLVGRVRGVGHHPAGVVISREPISKYVPIETTSNPKVKGERLSMTAYDMDDAASVGLVKYDLLGLKTLTVISDTLKSIGDRLGVTVDLESLEFDDPNIYKMMSEGHTVGIFQLEAAPYTKLVKEMGVDTFSELVATNALVRPGAMNTIGKEYIARKKGLKKVTYIHPDTKWFTEGDYGVATLMQEGIMLLGTELAGLSMDTANKIRKIVAKKQDAKLLEPYKKMFVDGCMLKVTKAVADKLWKDICAGASYSFNRSHSTGYSMLSYYTAWLKYYYPIDYLTACLSNADDAAGRVKYLIECNRLGIKVLPPHVNKSLLGFTCEEEGVRLGLNSLKYVGAVAAKKIIEKRPFESYEHLLEVSAEKYSGINKRALESMQKVGASEFDDNPITGDEKDNYFDVLGIPSIGGSGLPANITNQFTQLADYDSTDTGFVYAILIKQSILNGSPRLEIADETGTATIFGDTDVEIKTGGVYVFLVAQGRMVWFSEADTFENADESDIVQDKIIYTFLNRDYISIEEDERVVLGFKKRKTKAGAMMATLVTGDQDKLIETTLVFPSIYKKAWEKAVVGRKIKPYFDQTKDGALFLKGI